MLGLIGSAFVADDDECAMNGAMDGGCAKYKSAISPTRPTYFDHSMHFKNVLAIMILAVIAVIAADDNCSNDDEGAPQCSCHGGGCANICCPKGTFCTIHDGQNSCVCGGGICAPACCVSALIGLVLTK